ncbi:hypothetical protein [Curtobacterium pusillum]|uniref:hypothetical protein n=1 Tax=Curtobacterium pusillum TaxID=69373 RepID=UPI001643DA23|nr:hypothetical protein [Curtobacterium pusillum]
MANSPAVLACVVLAHEDPAHVRRLVEALDPTAAPHLFARTFPTAVSSDSTTEVGVS